MDTPKAVSVTLTWSDDEWVNTETALLITGKSIRTLYRWIEGNPPRVRAVQDETTKRWLFSVADLMLYIPQDRIAFYGDDTIEVCAKPPRRHT